MTEKTFKYVIGGTLLVVVIVLPLSLLFGFLTLVDTKNESSVVANTASTLEEINTNQDLVQETPHSDSLIGVKKYSLGDLIEAIDIIKKVITPNPLNQLAGVGTFDNADPLTRSGIVAWTNIKRIEDNIPPLTESLKLNEVARLRLEDMFTNQYFDHVSPSGVGVSEVSTSAGYDFIAVGENLALGGFGADEDVVQAWMDSPGHRSNMLARRYLEVGVAVKEGDYKGRPARMAVQILGTPLNTCPIPNEALKKQVLNNKNKLSSLGSELELLQQNIDQLDLLEASARRIEIRNFNRLAIEYNNLLEVTRAAIEEYNLSVQKFNNCAQAVN